MCITKLQNVNYTSGFQIHKSENMTSVAEFSSNNCEKYILINRNDPLTKMFSFGCVFCRAQDPGHDVESQWSPEPKGLHAPAPPPPSSSARHHTHGSHAHHQLQPVAAGERRLHGRPQPGAEVSGEPWPHDCIITTFKSAIKLICRSTQN